MAIKSSDQITIVDITDAYSVILTSEAYTFVGGTSGVASGAKCSTQAVALCGSSQCSNVSVTQANITCPTGVSAAVTNNNSSAVTITFTTTATISAACEATIPVTVDGITVNKKFSFAVAKAGTNGSNGKDGTSVTITSTSVTYQAGSSGTEKPTGSWVAQPPSVANGQYLWTKTVVNYSDGKSTEAYSVSYKGTNGSNGTSVTVTNTATTYQVSSSGTTTPTGTWLTSVPTVDKGKFLWTKSVTTYSDGKTATSYSVSYMGTNGKDGADGADGADAISISITTSAGNVFKNSEGSTILTAHVFVAGVELTSTEIAAIGTLKWYKTDDDETNVAAGTGATLTVAAADIDNKAAYTVQLEA